MDKNIVIIGYGNQLRGDDGVGLLVLDELSHSFSGRPDICLIRRHQLDIADTEDISQSRAVIFVDAHVSEEREDVELSELDLVEGATYVVTHISLPEELMSATQAIYGTAPSAYVCAVRGYDFEFGTAATENARKLVTQAARDIVEMVEKL
jgi:hydrogenase maturation protease